VAPKRAVVAMSGGVDSSVAAALLVESGFDVTGIMLKLWRGDAANSNSGCCNLGAAEDARRVADALGIPFYVLNFAELFEGTVVRSFHQEYAAGRTPNPCVRCNQWVKFDALLERATTLGADHLATGHYARVRKVDGAYRLFRGADEGKDQSYVLWMLTQDQIAHALFPVGEMSKSETRRIATELGLRTASKPDSQEICFVREGDVSGYVDEHIVGAAVPGPIVDGEGRALARHRGIGHYTVGQRKGLGISLGAPVFVTRIDAATNTVTVGSRRDLRVARFTTEETSFVDTPPTDEIEVIVQHRAHGETNAAALHRIESDRWEVRLVDPVFAIARGQSAAFYSADEPDRLLGGGIISSTIPAAVVA
jgi:tRNA-uridine 2-sulfurtransferase